MCMRADVAGETHVSNLRDLQVHWGSQVSEGMRETGGLPFPASRAGDKVQG